jgi:hypothetical protein
MADQDSTSMKEISPSSPLLKGPQCRSPFGQFHSFRKLRFFQALTLAGLFSFLIMKTQLIWAVLPAHILASAIPLLAPKPLLFDKHGVFKITVFNDMHFGEGEDNPPELGWGPLSDKKTTQVMETILDMESQDLVVLNGDLITGENTYFHNSTRYFDIVVAPMVRRNRVWASTYGNHDSQYNLSTQSLLLKEMTYPELSLTRDMVKNPDAGVSNYYLPVYGKGQDPALILWFFDSRGGSKYQQETPGGGTVGIDGVVHNAVGALMTWSSQLICRQLRGSSRRSSSSNRNMAGPYRHSPLYTFPSLPCETSRWRV